MRFRSAILALAFTAALVAPSFAVQASSSQPVTAFQTQVAYGRIAMFESETAAQRHCPSDQVVWLNTRSGIYHEKGMRWYGRTKQGAYVCRKEANAAGYRDTRNGQ